MLLTWEGFENNSLEKCKVRTVKDGFEIKSVVEGIKSGEPYYVRYAILVNSHWETISAQIYFEYQKEQRETHFYKDKKGVWILNGFPAEPFNSCTEIDLPVTPFTNTLPINRLQLKNGEEHSIDIIYIDLLEDQLKPVKQKYKNFLQVYIIMKIFRMILKRTLWWIQEVL